MILLGEMVERVARAQRRRRFERTRRLGAGQPVGIYDPEVEPTANEMDDARAAIEAMRDPTEEMLVAAYPHSGVNREIARQDWQAMIDKALGGEHIIGLDPVVPIDLDEALK